MKDQIGKYIAYVSENRDHWVFRCPFCGDSKNASHGHLYVAKSLPVFRCVRCGQAGSIRYLVDSLNATDIIIPEYLDKGFQSRKSNRKIKQVKVKREYESDILEYMSNRLGLRSILPELNMISKVDYRNLFNQHSSDGLPVFDKVVPFLSYRNKRMIARVLNNKDFRYFSYPLETTTCADYYIIQNERRHSSYRKHKTIIIAEGIFDIVNQYISRFIETADDSVYAASLTRSMSPAFKQARSIALTYYPNIKVLADNDTPDDYYCTQFKTYESIEIWRNKQGKDFGDKPVEPYLSFKKNK